MVTEGAEVLEDTEETDRLDGGRRLIPEGTSAADTPATPIAATPAVTESTTVSENTDATSQDGDTGTCCICAELVKYYSVSEFNHRTCHVCGLRLRALYGRRDCAFCQVRLPFRYKNELESTNDFSFPIGAPKFLDLHDISHSNVHIVQAERYPLQ